MSHGEAREGGDPLDAVGEDLLLVVVGEDTDPGLWVAED